MARQVLENGVILPAEYSDDWYDDMTSNLTKLDDVIGSDSEKLSSADVGAAALSNSYNDLDNLPTIPTKTSDLTNDSNFVDTSNSAVASGITSAKVTDYDSHIADTDIHVTTADKSKWNNGVSQSYVLRYSSSSVIDNSTIAFSTLDNTDNIKSGDKVIDVDGKIFSVVSVDTTNQTVTVGSALIDLALDANVVHTSGDETKSGLLTFKGGYLGNEPSTSFRTVLQLLSKYDTAGKSGWLVSKFRSNSSQGALSGSDTVFLNFDVLENEVRTNGILRFNLSSWSGNTPGRFSLIPNSAIESYLGTSGNKWAAINGLNPSALSLPDFSKGIDISSYLSVGASTNDSYTAPANGYIGVIFASSSACGCYVYNYTDGVFMRSNSITDSTYTNVCGCFIPILKNQTLNISTRATESVVSAKFFPCQGNV